MTPAPTPASDPLTFAEPAGWEAWLDGHHATATEAWLRLAKRGAPAPTITHAQALDSALCFGWIDGVVRRLDEHYLVRRFTPRTTRSRWSQVNCANVVRLAEAGRMRPAGQAQIDAARADGRWDRAYAPPSTIEVPADLRAALDAAPAAATFFATLHGSDRYAYLYRLHHVDDPGRRAARIADYVTRLAAGRSLSD